MRVLAAMSGGVDSAVAAARAVDAGHEVTGVHLALSRAGGTLRAGSRGCCTVEDAMDARRAADRLGIPFYVWDFSERFRDDVIEDFVAEYAAGRTPNPCMRCNERIKFAAVLEKALDLGFDAVCTGHYAILRAGQDGRLELHRASDAAKDQSYVLGMLTADQLVHTMFPLGQTPSKALVRAEAQERGLTVASKPDSHDICFIPDGDTRGWLAERVGAEPGEIVDRDGEVVGAHEGAHAFTVGQRKGLRLGMPASDGKPRFVLEVRPVTNTVVVGPKDALAIAQISGARVSWTSLDAVPAGSELDCQVQIRAHADPVEATAWWDPAGDGQPRLTVRPRTPLDGVAPGQTAVLYDGTRVLGQFTIDDTVSAVAAAV
ncbi:tRNA 2-thiouridine(34) synthase MnmA [Microbacterium sp. LRZ72]|uniref:tRNA 2-thiouridine(34) synthase MnmA n=1 Tax=Microbacterium sp. LRZ72 TaxID=2942481 RepID=UPI0029A1AEED|nr:tRNA 2-thiouridine(34) synthase MnmA [Microbacterium sp. LRZ72]MDX2375547.1 tRNA 2-thiouridine(34) synthase MnmA [Microbacterium sp. LRZ72]